jgi:acetyl-CoA carboxylase biotin carboxyl carrier protein
VKEIKASMAGTVLSIQVLPGEEISVGQEVFILESMKMAIPIESSETGKVARINVKIGDFVNEDDVLMSLE